MLNVNPVDVWCCCHHDDHGRGTISDFVVYICVALVYAIYAYAFDFGNYPWSKRVKSVWCCYSRFPFVVLSIDIVWNSINANCDFLLKWNRCDCYPVSVRESVCASNIFTIHEMCSVYFFYPVWTGSKTLTRSWHIRDAKTLLRTGKKLLICLFIFCDCFQSKPDLLVVLI